MKALTRIFLCLSIMSLASFSFAESTKLESSDVKCMKQTMQESGSSIEEAYQNCSIKK